jgi:hypothetical protein
MSRSLAGGARVLGAFGCALVTGLAAPEPASPEPAATHVAATPDPGVETPRAPKRCPAGEACTWARTYGGAREDKLRAGTRLSGGDVILVGKTRSHAGLRAAGWVMRLNRAGEPIWTRNLRGGADLDALTGVVLPAGDGELILGGYTTSNGAGYEDGWVLRLDPEGRL